MNVIQGGPTPVVSVPLKEAVAAPVPDTKTVIPAVAVKAAVKAEAASTGPRYTPHTEDAALRGRRVDVLA